MRKSAALGAGLILMALLASQAQAAAPPPPSPKVTPKPKTHTVRGTIESFDAAASTLTVKSTKATWVFGLLEAKVWQGTKSVAVESLHESPGAKVKVKYKDADAQHVAVTVRVAAPADRNR
jgi:hypothetical protein